MSDITIKELIDLQKKFNRYCLCGKDESCEVCSDSKYNKIMGELGKLINDHGGESEWYRKPKTKIPDTCWYYTSYTSEFMKKTINELQVMIDKAEKGGG